MNDRQSVMFLKVQCGQFIIAGNNTNYLQTGPAIFLRKRCDTQRFLLAASSPAGAEFEKNRDPLIILGRDLAAITVHKRKFKFSGFQRQCGTQPRENDCKRYSMNTFFSLHLNALS
jgi:hypothetical protein